MPDVQFDHPRPDIAAQFRREMLALGVSVIGENGETLRPHGREVPPVPVAPLRRAPLPRVIEFDEEGEEHTVVVKRRNGERVELHMVLRYGAMREFDDLQAEVARWQAAAREAPDRATRKAIAAVQLAAEEDVLRLLFDDLPDGLIGSLDPRTVRKLTETFGAMLQEAIGGEGDSPNEDGPDQ